MHTSNTNRGGRATTTSRNDDEDDNGPLSNEGALSAKISGALPLEKVETKRSLENKTVKELTAEVKENQTKKCPRSKTKFEGPYPLEKAELVDFVLHLRGEPVCSVCFDQFEEGEYVRVLPCAHRYHIECVDRWLASKSIRCPVCQHPADER